jgi:hypothetical protein
VVALQPDFEQVVEAPVFGHVLGRKVAVIVEDRLTFRIFVVETARGLSGQQKIFMDEWHLVYSGRFRITFTYETRDHTADGVFPHGGALENAAGGVRPGR